MWPCSYALLVHACCVWSEARSLVGCIRFGLGSWTFLHLLWTVACWIDFYIIRRQTRQNTRSWTILQVYRCQSIYNKRFVFLFKYLLNSFYVSFRIIEQHRVNALFTIPTAFRVLKRADPAAKFARRYCGKSLKTVFIAGEHCDQDTQVSLNFSS